jgi:hypothetical protein
LRANSQSTAGPFETGYRCERFRGVPADLQAPGAIDKAGSFTGNLSGSLNTEGSRLGESGGDGRLVKVNQETAISGILISIESNHQTLIVV